MIAEANADDVNAAVAAARQAFDHGPWPTMSVSERANALRRMAEILRGRIPELAAAFYCGNWGTFILCTSCRGWRS